MLTVGGYLSSVFQFLLYGLGMGFVITVLTFGAALAQQAVINSARRLGRYVQPVAVLMLLAGAHIVCYWLTVGGLLAMVR